MKTKQDVAILVEKVFSEISFLRESGHKEYAGGENALGNFERLAATLQMSREKVLWTYVTKHLDGIVAWINGHKSQRESVEGRINDAIVYLILLRAMVEDSQEVKEEVIVPMKRLNSVILQDDELR